MRGLHNTGEDCSITTLWRLALAPLCTAFSDHVRIESNFTLPLSGPVPELPCRVSLNAGWSRTKPESSVRDDTASWAVAKYRHDLPPPDTEDELAWEDEGTWRSRSGWRGGFSCSLKWTRWKPAASILADSSTAVPPNLDSAGVPPSYCRSVCHGGSDGGCVVDGSQRGAPAEE